MKLRPSHTYEAADINLQGNQQEQLFAADSAVSRPAEHRIEQQIYAEAPDSAIATGGARHRLKIVARRALTSRSRVLNQATDTSLSQRWLLRS